MTSEDTINNCKSKMKKAFDIFNTDLGSLRTGRANVAMLDIIKVDVYGQKMSINQLATISNMATLARPVLNEPKSVLKMSKAFFILDLQLLIVSSDVIIFKLPLQL
jgi:ribosome recycling factor